MATESRSFTFLVETFLGNPLPSALLGGLSFPSLTTEGQEFVLRVLALMQRAAYPATDINPYMLRLLSDVIPGLLPSAWGGRIPPITAAGRHARLDAYVAAHPVSSSYPPPVFIDLGCGFPPLTTLDTARHFPHWKVYGIDRSFPRYMVHDRDAHYALFDRGGRYLYFQAQMTPSGRDLYENPAHTRVHFETIYAQLLPQLKTSGADGHATAENGSGRIICNPVHDFSADNLTLMEAEIEGLDLPRAQVVRCMNVLLYATPAAREKLLRSAMDLLREKGMLVAGTCHHLGIYARYAVYRKGAMGSISCEFAFSRENLRPLGIGPWFTIHPQDPEAELLADLIAAVRQDSDFWPGFTRRIDTLLAQYGVCRRRVDGFLHLPPTPLTAGVLLEKMAALWQQLDDEGVGENAVASLCRSGYMAWTNEVGDITVRPPAGFLPMV